MITAPLSFQQAETLRNMQRNPDCASVYDLIRVFEIDGSVDVDALAAAIGDLVSRHPALRTSVAQSGSEPLQSVSEHGSSDVERRSGYTDAGFARLLEQLVGERYGLQEAVSGAPFFRPLLYAGHSTHLLVLRVHHLVYDRWSESVLWRDLSELYAARLHGRPPSLPELPDTYAEFASAQRAEWPRLAEKAIPFWQAQLSGYPPEPISWPRTVGTGGDDGNQAADTIRSLSDDGLRRVRQAAQASKVFPFRVLLAATALAISRVTQRRDLLLGTSTANREDPRTHDVVGYFTNTRMTRIRLAEIGTCADVIRSANQSWLESDAFSDSYVDKILEGVGGDRPTMSRVELMGGPPVCELEGGGVRPISVVTESKHWRDVDFFWTPNNGSYALRLRHRVATVSEDLAHRIVDEIESALADIEAGRPTQRP